MQKVYFIPGLGADKRIFSSLDLSFCEPVFVDWIAPNSKETLTEYAVRLKKQINEPHPIIVGISLGGMLVTEMAKTDSNVKGILLSSIKTRKEFPWYLKPVRIVTFHKWIPASLLKQLILWNTWILGHPKNEQKQLLRQIIRDTDMKFVKWAITAILNWKNDNCPHNIIHIHGTADKLLPYRFVKPDYTINGGSHIITIDHPAEIFDLLKKLIG